MNLDEIVCMDALAYMRGLEDASVDLIVTSPPYDNLRTYNGYTWDFEGIAGESYRVLKPGGVLVWVVGDATVNGSETLTSMRQALHFVDVVGFNMHDTMIYHKNGMVMNNHHPRYIEAFEYMFVLSKGKPKSFNPIMRTNKNAGVLSGAGKRQRNGEIKTFANVRTPTPETSLEENIWRIYSGGGHNDDFSSQHPASFPEALAERHILTWSNPGDIVLDFFMGSGTTAKMARNTGRHYLGCDLSPEYVAIARARLAQPYTPPLFTEQPVPETPPEQTPLW
jgi:DNA modification methylase